MKSQPQDHVAVALAWAALGRFASASSWRSFSVWRRRSRTCPKILSLKPLRIARTVAAGTAMLTSKYWIAAFMRGSLATYRESAHSGPQFAPKSAPCPSGPLGVRMLLFLQIFCCRNRSRYLFLIGERGGNRTHDPLIKSRILGSVGGVHPIAPDRDNFKRRLAFRPYRRHMRSDDAGRLAFEICCPDVVPSYRSEGGGRPL